MLGSGGGVGVCRGGLRTEEAGVGADRHGELLLTPCRTLTAAALGGEGGLGGRQG